MLSQGFFRTPRLPFFSVAASIRRNSTAPKYKCTLGADSQAIIAKATHGFMGISVGERYQSGRRLSALITLLNSHFDEKPCTIYVCDTLKAHNYLPFKASSLAEARLMAIQNGDTWLKTHEEQLTRFSSRPLHSIKRWNDFLFDPKYPETFQKVMYLYQSDRMFRDTVLRSAQLHLTRIKQTNHPELITHSINYLLEECAGMAIVFGQAPEKGCVELYPGNLADCLDYLTGKALPEILRGLSIRQSAIVDFEEYRPGQNPMIF